MIPEPSHHLRTARRSRRHTGFLLVAAAGLLVTAILLVGNSMGHAQTRAENAIPRNAEDVLPKDAYSTCAAPCAAPCAADSCAVAEDAFFKSWFDDKGVLQPANSIAFPDKDNRDFYQWSEQMFLWLTSPDPASKSGGRIIDSSEFYDVSPERNGKRTFLPHGTASRTFSLRSAQAGPHGLQVLFDKAGKMFEIAPLRKTPGGKPLVLDKLGKLVEVASARMKDGKPVFLDKAGHPIVSLKPVPGALAQAAPPLAGARSIISMAYEFMVGQTPIFLDANGEVINIGVGQAGGDGVLMAQNGSLVYYATMVNDVFAYFLTRAKTDVNKPAPTQFPTTPAELKEVTDFAISHGKVLKHPNTLVIEVKSSWVEADKLKASGFDPETYITMEATIPTYDRTNPGKWVFTGSKPARLAMVGMHVVGSVKGNPEMLWATFEHFRNTPNAAYEYVAKDGNGNETTKFGPGDQAGTWMFWASNSNPPFNVMHMRTSGGDIVGDHQQISASNTVRMKPWGGAFNSKPNEKVASTAASNSEIITINNSVLRRLPAGDIRKYYFMVGNTWTKGGAAPTGPYPGSGAEVSGQEVGTSQLANSTMETYDQGDRTFSRDTNCFSCHTAHRFDGDPLTSVSHIYGELEPLPLPPG